MGRARRARRIAANAAYGGGGLAATTAALGALGYVVVRAEAALARRVMSHEHGAAPDDDGTYGAALGEPVRIVVLGDSTAAGLGADTREQTIGAIVASGVAALLGRRVELTNRAVIGAQSTDLERQLATAVEVVPAPDVVLVLIGANDVTHRIDRAVAVRSLESMVRHARDLGAEVVVGTCPDLGTIEPLAQPLRGLARRWSRDLAAAQTVAVVEAGGRTVSLGDLLGPEFAAAPREMFSEDRFHPSPAGYARAASALLPSVCAALGVWGGRRDHTGHDEEPLLGQPPRPVAVAAGKAVLDPGTEVAPVDVAGQSRGPRGRWAALRHRAIPTRARPATPMPDSAQGPALSGPTLDSPAPGPAHVTRP